MPTRGVGIVRSDAANVAAVNASLSAWIDLGAYAEALELRRSSTGGTYALELDWSNDAGSTLVAGSPFDVTSLVPAGSIVEVPVRGRYVRVRVRNTHATLPFTAHLTEVRLRERDRRPRGRPRRRRR